YNQFFFHTFFPILNESTFDVAERIERNEVLFHPFVRIDRRHLPAAVAGGNHLDERKTFSCECVFECLADGLFGFAHGGGSVYRLTGDVAYAGKRSYHVGYLVGEAVYLRVAAVGAGSRFHADERGRGHLTAGHTVNGIVDEDYDDVLAAVAGVYRFRSTDGGQVAVALIGEHHLVGIRALDGGSYGTCTSVCSLRP